MSLTWKISILFAILTVYSTAHGQALSETTALLSDPAARQADRQVKGLGLKSADQEKVYQVSGKVFETLAAKTDGDPEKMNEKIQDLLRDPASLERDLSPELKTEIHDIAAHQK